MIRWGRFSTAISNTGGFGVIYFRAINVLNPASPVYVQAGDCVQERISGRVLKLIGCGAVKAEKGEKKLAYLHGTVVRRADPPVNHGEPAVDLGLDPVGKEGSYTSPMDDDGTVEEFDRYTLDTDTDDTASGLNGIQIDQPGPLAWFFSTLRKIGAGRWLSAASESRQSSIAS